MSQEYKQTKIKCCGWSYCRSEPSKIPWSFVYRKNPFPVKNQTLKTLQSIYFVYEVGIISSYSNNIKESRTPRLSSAVND